VLDDIPRVVIRTFAMTSRQFTLADFERPQFTRPQAVRITGLTEGQLKGILDRKLVELDARNSGSGRARLFSLRDLSKIAIANELAALGIPMFAVSTAAHLAGFGVRAHLGEETNSGKVQLILHRKQDGGWMWREQLSGEPLDDDLPLCYVMIGVQEIVGNLASRADAVLDETINQ
jgi:hypothetical protein